ncbi:protein phosphatase 1 regulatory subunit 3A [Periophthalmus magnuspinnatus]|uniref:protein phosphatase 1 regulatory subunit 3A n=1 Tax=Periophthalmus magnuspinnatus TaxID=409849 RepID=UPI002436A59A|nr:protein phosphatase 1 regulatory subunit 3A [Periophthalmus magnuspinnatus]
MEFVGSRGSFAGGSGLLVVPGQNYLEVDSDNDDEEVVIGIRPKSSPQPRRKTSVSEEESDISEPPSLSGSRRVSFADTVGLSLVQVKEFDKWDIPQLPDFLDSTNNDEDEYFISPFNFPLSLPSDEIVAKVLDQKVELESIELLPGTTILKGLIRVLNISFTKAVYVRTSLDNWLSHFDLLCEYIPGSSDGHSDSFSFKLTLMPPFAEQGARVDFCLRYETPNGTFWANNRNRNYVLFCYKRKKEIQDKPQREHLNKRSCLKTVSQSFSVDESMSCPERENHAPDVTTQQKIIIETSQTSAQSDSSPVKSEEEANTLQGENRRNRNRRNRRKAARMARVREHMAQKDLTSQDSETQAPPEQHIPTAQEQNQNSKLSNPKGSVEFDCTADGSLSKDSNCTKYENFNLAEVVANDSRCESKDMPKVATALHQNTDNFVCTGEETSLEVARYCGHHSGERDDSKSLVSDSSGFAFGTVVAPLYQEVSGKRVGSQLYSEIYNTSETMKEQQETEERSSNAEINVCKDIGGCCNDGKVESSEQVGATSGNDEIINIDTIDAIEKSTSEKIWDLETENSGLNLNHQVHLENDNSSSRIDMNTEETLLTTGAQDSPFEFEKQPCQNVISDIIDPNMDSSDPNLALPPQCNVLFQEANAKASLLFQLSQNECLQNETSESSDGVQIGMTLVDKSLATPLLDASGNSKENVSLLFQPSQDEELVDQSANISNVIHDPSLVPETCPIVSPSHLSKTSEENLHMNPQISQNGCLLDLSTQTSKAKDEISLEFEDQTRAVSPNHISETPGDADQSLSLEQHLTKNVSDQPANISNPINEPGQDSEASILIVSSHVSAISEDKNTQLTLQLCQNADWSDHENKSIVFKDQSVAISPTCTFPTPEKGNLFLLLEQNKGFVDQPNNNSDLTGEINLDNDCSQTHVTKLSIEENTADVTTVITQSYQCEIPEERNVLPEQSENLENKSEQEHNSTRITQSQEFDENVDENACLLLGASSCLQDNSSNHSDFMDEVYDRDADCVTVPSSQVSKSWSPQQAQNDNLTNPDEINIQNDEKSLEISNFAISDEENKKLSIQVENEGLHDQLDNSNDPIVDLALDKVMGKIEAVQCQETHKEENASLPSEDLKCNRILLVNQPINANDLLAQSELVLDLTAAVFEKEEKKCLANIALESHDITANPGITFEDKSEVAESCAETELQDISKRNEEKLNETVEMDRQLMVDNIVDDVVESETRTNCNKDDEITASENVAHFEIWSHIETMELTLEDEAKSWEVMVDEEQENLDILTTSEDIEDVITSLKEDDKVESLDSKMGNVELLEIASAVGIDGQNATKDIQTNLDALDELETAQKAGVNNDGTYFEPVENDKLDSLDSKLDTVELLEIASAVRTDVHYATEAICKKSDALDECENAKKSKVNKDTYFEPVFEVEMQSFAENVEGCASVNEKQLNECIESNLMDSVANLPVFENTDVDYIGEVKVKMQLKSNEEERFKIPPRRARSNIPARMDNVQKGIQSIQVETVEEPTHMPIEIGNTDLLSKDTIDNTFELKYDQNSDDSSTSESESDSEDEMELYMHCLRAVYGQQSSPKALKPELNRDKEFKRLPSIRSKRLSTSLPSISESLDEEQPRLETEACFLRSDWLLSCQF